MIKRFDIADSHVVECTSRAGRIVVATAPDNGERAAIGEEFLLDEYDLNSTLDPDEVPRLEVTGKRVLLIWKTPQRAVVSEPVELGVNVIGLALANGRLAFVAPRFVVSFEEREFRRLEDTLDAMLTFLLRTIRHFVGHLRVIRQISNEVEKKITVSMENKHLLQMFALSESLVYYLDAIEGNGAVLGKLRSLGDQIGFQGRHLEMLDDIILENAQAARQASIYSSVLSGLMDARGTVVNNNMNVLLKNLTLINIVFLPLNLIASIGGMSEWSMMTNGVDWRVSYGLFCLAMVVLGWGMWVFMRTVVDRSHLRADEKPAAQAVKPLTGNARQPN